MIERYLVNTQVHVLSEYCFSEYSTNKAYSTKQSLNKVPDTAYQCYMG